MTALQFTTDFILKEFENLTIKQKDTIVEMVTYVDSWEEFIIAFKENKNDLVEWSIVELPNWKGLENILPTVKMIEDGFETGEGDFCVFELDGKFIKVSYSNFERMCFQTIEFDFVKQVEILVPTKTWQIIK